MGLRTTEPLPPFGLIPLYCGRQPHGARVRRGIESRGAEGELNAVQTRRYRRFRDLSAQMRDERRNDRRRNETTSATVVVLWYDNGGNGTINSRMFAL